ncbi:putative protein phosphatase 2C 8 [Drosera capensis]
MKQNPQTLAPNTSNPIQLPSNYLFPQFHFITITILYLFVSSIDQKYLRHRATHSKFPIPSASNTWDFTSFRDPMADLATAIINSPSLPTSPHLGTTHQNVMFLLHRRRLRKSGQVPGKFRREMMESRKEDDNSGSSRRRMIEECRSGGTQRAGFLRKWLTRPEGRPRVEGTRCSEAGSSVAMEGERMREKDHDDEYDDYESTCGSRGWASVIGRRREMEDAVTVAVGFAGEAPRVFDYFAVFDGHGGAAVAEACRDRMHMILEAEVVAAMADVEVEGGGGVDWERVMGRCFEKMDDEVADRGGEERRYGVALGSTAVVMVVGKEEVVVGNCGDSRAVLCSGGSAFRLSSDHKPDRPDELARIKVAGGRVINYNGPRVMGVLATSRSIGSDSGDHYLRPYVISRPEVNVYRRTSDDEFLILATDGLWDVMSDQEACQLVKSCLYGGNSGAPETVASGSVIGSRHRASRTAALLAQLAIAQGSNDSITVIVIELRKYED